MRRDEILLVLREHQTEFDTLGVSLLALFGSVVRGEAGPESDGVVDDSRFGSLRHLY